VWSYTRFIYVADSGCDIGLYAAVDITTSYKAAAATVAPVILMTDVYINCRHRWFVEVVRRSRVPGGPL